MITEVENLSVRDPFILLSDGIYYMYGTRTATVWGPADGFDVYRSRDLKTWDGPYEIFHNNGDFWATENYWAPECIERNGKFYLIATFGHPKRKKGIQILKSDSPMGPFIPLTESPITPENWNSIDGTVYIDLDSTPYLVFSHSLPEEPRGAIAAAPLSDDLTHLTSEPFNLFFAKDAPWARPIPFAKAEFGLDGDVYFSDGPYLVRDEGELCMIWSSWSENGYAIGKSVSVNGKIDGKWIHSVKPLFSGNGGHGMIFKDKDKSLKIALHSPNETPSERLLVMPFADRVG